MAEIEVNTNEAKDTNKAEETAPAEEVTSIVDDDDQDSATTGDEGGVDIDEVAQTLMAQGKRNLVIGEIVQAVQEFQEVSALLAAKYGETASECGEAYFKYGTALLELARTETGVLGNALDGVPDEPDQIDETATEVAAGSNVLEIPKNLKEPEKEQIFKDVYNAMDEDSEERKAKKKGGESVENDEAGCSKDVDRPGTSGEDVNAEDGESADDISNFQLAWEMLELARVIFMREDREKKLQIANVHLTLGELSMETENYTQSIKDFSRCLRLRTKHLETDSRLLAETHYNLGLVYCLDRQFDLGMQSYDSAMKVINQRINNLREKITKPNCEDKEKDIESIDSEVPVEVREKEIKELEELLPDISTRIEDAKETKKSDPGKTAMMETAFGSTSSGFAQSSSSAPVNVISVKSQKKDNPTNVSHLIRKKRKPEETDDATDAKKSKNEETTNEETTNEETTNGRANGDASNGHANGDKNANEQQIKTKTVEDVLASKECSMETS